MTDPQQYEVAAMVERLREAVENYDEDIYALAMKAAALLERLGFQVSTTEVGAVEMPNRPGALASLAGMLAENQICARGLP